MSNDKDTKHPDVEELDEALGAAEDEIELSEDQARSIAQSGRTDEMARAASLAVAQVERQKDSPQAMSQEITQKYLQMGKTLLSDGKEQHLSGRVRDRVTRILGHDPGDVRIHSGERAAQAADALGAQAFAVGDSDVYFGRGKFDPETAEGMGVLVHELTHVADNAVGAAFSTQAGNVQYSAAEERAEAAERFAVDTEGEGTDNEGETGHEIHAAEEEALDLQKLEDAVAKLLERSERHSHDRTGVSGLGPDRR